MRYLVAGLLAVLAAGCGGGADARSTPVPLDQVPEPLLKIAREKLPAVKFDRALRRPNGDYEIKGKERNGKEREVELKPTGEVVEID